MDARLEERYVVLKLKHLDNLRRIELDDFLQENGIPTVDCVVVEHDWPEYIPTVDAIMARMYAESLPDTLPPRIDQETPSLTYGEFVLPPLARKQARQLNGEPYPKPYPKPSHSLELILVPLAAMVAGFIGGALALNPQWWMP